MNRTTGLAEMSDTQAAMNLLGNESEVSSHQFVFLHAWAAVGYQNTLSCSTLGNNVNNSHGHANVDFDQEGSKVATEFTVQVNDHGSNDGNFTKDNNDEKAATDCEDETDHDTDTGPHDGDSAADGGNGETTVNHESEPENHSAADGGNGETTVNYESEPENHEFESEFTEVKNRRGKKYTMYVDHEGHAHAISQHEIYRHRVANWDMKYRDPNFTDKEYARRYRRTKTWKDQAGYEQECGLKEYSLLQFAIHVTLKRFPPSGTIKADNTRAFRLNKSCPLYKSHYLHLNSKEKIPILAGKTRPGPPQGERPKDARRGKRWETHANRFARYMGAVLFPWDRNGDCGVHDWKQFQQKVLALKHSLHRADHSVQKKYCDTFHLQYLNNVASNMRTSDKIKKTTHAWGSECAQRFSKESVRKFSNESQNRSTVVRSAEQLQELLARATAEQAIVASSTDAAKSTKFIEDMEEEMESLYAECDSMTDLADVAKNARTETSKWNKFSRTYDKKWVDNRRAQLNKRELTCDPIVDHPFGKRRTLTRNAKDKLKRIRQDLDANDEWTHIFDHVKKTWLSGQQLLLFIHGGPGTGKTTLAKAIMEMASVFNFEHRFSATSGVAGLLNNGTTIHHLLGQQGELTGTQPNINKIRLRNGNARVVIVDEVSVRRAENR